MDGAPDAVLWFGSNFPHKCLPCTNLQCELKLDSRGKTFRLLGRPVFFPACSSPLHFLHAQCVFENFYLLYSDFHLGRGERKSAYELFSCKESWRQASQGL